MSAFFNPISLVHLNYLPFFLSETVEEPQRSFADLCLKANKYTVAKASKIAKQNSAKL